MAEELFFKVEELFCKQDVEKLIKVVCSNTRNRWRANYSIGRQKGPEGKLDEEEVSEGKLDEEEKKDEEKCDIFKHMIEDLTLKFYNGDHETA